MLAQFRSPAVLYPLSIYDRKIGLHAVTLLKRAKLYKLDVVSKQHAIKSFREDITTNYLLAVRGED